MSQGVSFSPFAELNIYREKDDRHKDLLVFMLTLLEYKRKNTHVEYGFSSKKDKTTYWFSDDGSVMITSNYYFF